MGPAAKAYRRSCRGERGSRVLLRMLADDLTGAADAAAPLTRAGLTAYACLEAGAPIPPTDVLALVTASRLAEPAAAAAAVRRAAATAPAAPEALSFKKVDSLLRGSVAEETLAALQAWGLPRAVVAPALPALGRTTVGGVQLLHGRRVDALEGQPERSTDADLRAVLQGVPCEVCDAVGDADLDAVVARFWGQPVLWVGTAGLAAALARRLAPGTAPRAAWRAADVLVVAGSRTAVTARQLAVLAAPDCGQDAQAAQRALATDGLALLRADTPDQWPPLIEAAARVRTTASVLTGGDTALAVLRRRGVTGLELLGEERPGTAVARDPVAGGLILTKSGSFGDEQTLRSIVGGLKGDATWSR